MIGCTVGLLGNTWMAASLAASLTTVCNPGIKVASQYSLAFVDDSLSSVQLHEEISEFKSCFHSCCPNRHAVLPGLDNITSWAFSKDCLGISSVSNVFSRVTL